MSSRLLKTVRVLAQDCETIAAACRKIERELVAADITGQPFDDARVNLMVRRIESRVLEAAHHVGIRRGEHGQR